MRSFFGDGQRRAGWPAPPQQLHSISIEMAPSASHATSMQNSSPPSPASADRASSPREARRKSLVVTIPRCSFQPASESSLSVREGDVPLGWGDGSVDSRAKSSTTSDMPCSTARCPAVTVCGRREPDDPTPVAAATGMILVLTACCHWPWK